MSVRRVLVDAHAEGGGLHRPCGGDEVDARAREAHRCAEHPRRRGRVLQVSVEEVATVRVQQVDVRACRVGGHERLPLQRGPLAAHVRPVLQFELHAARESACHVVGRHRRGDRQCAEQDHLTCVVRRVFRARSSDAGGAAIGHRVGGWADGVTQPSAAASQAEVEPRCAGGRVRRRRWGQRRDRWRRQRRQRRRQRWRRWRRGGGQWRWRRRRHLGCPGRNARMWRGWRRKRQGWWWRRWERAALGDGDVNAACDIDVDLARIGIPIVCMHVRVRP